MSEIDQRTSHAVARLREQWSPPAGVEERMLADFHARLGGPPDGGDAGPSSDGGPPISKATGQWLHVAKIIGAVAGLTAAGLGGLVVTAKLIGAGDRQPPPVRERPSLIAQTDVEQPADDPSPVEAPQADPTPTAALAEKGPSISAASAPPRVDAPTTPAPTKVDLAAELALIRQARAAKPEQALALLDRHAREFPSGALTSEREALRAVASCALDRLDPARAAVDRLVALDPGPLLRQRVRAACEKKIDLPTTGFARGGDGSP